MLAANTTSSTTAHDQAQVGGVAHVGRAGRGRQGGDRQRGHASTSSVEIIRVGCVPNCCVPCFSPPTKNASPSTSRLFARIEPTSAACTTTHQPGLQREDAR